MHEAYFIYQDQAFDSTQDLIIHVIILNKIIMTQNGLGLHRTYNKRLQFL